MMSRKYGGGKCIKEYQKMLSFTRKLGIQVRGHLLLRGGRPIGSETLGANGFW